MIAISTIFLLIVLSTCDGKSRFHKDCLIDKVDFATKVEDSSIVVYGKTVGKMLYGGNETTFYVSFQVDCILKGPAIVKQINITDAGEVKNKTYCQRFPVGGGYTIAFLERNPLNEHDLKTFIPADFVEMPFETNSTDELLANTCHLHQLVPLNTSAVLSDVCPTVSTASQCIVTTMKPHSELTSIGSGGSGNDFDHIRSKSGSISVDVDKNNGINSKNISILLILMAIFFVRLN